MFDKETSGEVPEYRDFMHNKLRPFCEANGIRFTILHSQKNYDDIFHKIYKSGKNTGKKYGFARPQGCFVNKLCKINTFKEYKRQQGANVVFYIGIAADEIKKKHHRK